MSLKSVQLSEFGDEFTVGWQIAGTATSRTCEAKLSFQVHPQPQHELCSRKFATLTAEAQVPQYLQQLESRNYSSPPLGTQGPELG